MRGLQILYVVPEETRDQGYILTEYFGRRLPGRRGRVDLTGYPSSGCATCCGTITPPCSGRPVARALPARSMT